VSSRAARSLIAAALLLGFGGPGCGAQPPSLALGLDLPLSGIDGAAGIPTRNAVVLAIEQANQRGFPGGLHVALEDLDDTVQGKHDPAQGAQNVKALVADPNVLAILGPLNSSVAKAEIPIAEAAGLAQITPAASAVELTDGPVARAFRAAYPGQTTFFRLCANDDRQGAAAARFARRLGLRRAFVIDDNESYGTGIADVFDASFARDGGSVLGHEHLVPFALDFKALLTKVKATHPDLVFFGGIVSTGGAVLRRQMGDVGLGRVRYFGGDGLGNPEYASLAGNEADGTYYTMLSPDALHFPAARAFVTAYRSRFGGLPGTYGLAAYAAAEVALAAIRQALAAHPGSLPSRDDVRANIAATAGLVTPVGPVAFDRAGDLERPAITLYQVEGGRVRYVGTAAGI
jgi:branched-chain amino acid transport system substrate-binding protein